VNDKSSLKMRDTARQDISKNMKEEGFRDILVDKHAGFYNK